MSKPFERKAFDQYGASMGRNSCQPSELTGKIHLACVPLYDGGYDKGGAYWGIGQPLFCAWDDEGNAYYFRDSSRENARRWIKSTNTSVTFYR